MTTAIVAVFALAYAVVALEHPLRINKAATALVGAGLMWTVYALSGHAAAQVAGELNESVAATA
ncbi:MAG: sodium:proton antiporter, partial [Bradyrhizobium sp.]|nr:sodium:proton antiporter [Bradyrhizobium sp.]